TVAALTEDRAEIAEFRRLARRRRGEIVARDRDRQVRTQAQLLAGTGIGDQVHAPPDVLAREVEKRLGRLEDRGCGRRIAGALIGGDERGRAQVLCLAHGWSSVPVRPAASRAPV